MPRQLPWAKKGSGSRTQVKPADPRPSAALRASNFDDDFLDDTVLASSSSKGTKKVNESDDDLANLPTELSTPRTESKSKDAFRRRRDESSLPPPVGHLDQPLVEGMHKGVSKFDLRDDRWMMVEDEFLETAKLFTRHLHIAEYGKLKEMMDAKKKGAEVARPVIANAKRSSSSSEAMKEKAKVQERRQKRAIRDAFASQDDDEEEHEQDTISMRTTHGNTTLSTSGPRRAPGGVVKQPPASTVASDSDSEDLDALQHHAKTAFKATSAKISSTTGGNLNIALSPTPDTSIVTPTLAKPAPPRAAPTSRSIAASPTPFDMLNDWISCKPQLLPKASPVAGRSKGLADRLAKRKAEREKRHGEKKIKTASADDIPTFLF